MTRAKKYTVSASMCLGTASPSEDSVMRMNSSTQRPFKRPDDTSASAIFRCNTFVELSSLDSSPCSHKKLLPQKTSVGSRYSSPSSGTKNASSVPRFLTIHLEYAVPKSKPIFHNL